MNAVQGTAFHPDLEDDEAAAGVANMSIGEARQRLSARAQSGPKRSSYVALALMGTASFAASFAAGNAFLNWKSPIRPAAAAAEQNCVGKADESQTCPRTGSGGRAAVFYYFSGSGRSTTSSYGSSSVGSAKLTNAGTTVVRESRSVSVKRNGFGTFARSISVGRVSVGG